MTVVIRVAVTVELSVAVENTIRVSVTMGLISPRIKSGLVVS